MERFKVCRCCDRKLSASRFSSEKRNSDGLKSYCKACIVKKVTAYKLRNEEKVRKYRAKYNRRNRVALEKYRKAYYLRTVDERRAYGRAYRKVYLKKAAKKIREASRIYERKRRREDPMYRLILNLRRRLNHLLNGQKSKRTLELTGCDRSKLRKHLERKFTKGMSWKNYGAWHVDHKIPLSKYNLFNERQLKKACHFTNLQPLWAADNIRKANRE